MFRLIFRGRNFILLAISLAFILNVASPLLAASPEPKSSGKFTLGKGTKAEESYEKEGRAGTPGYVWGRGLELGALILKPFLQYFHQWDSNIFFQDSNPKSDHIENLDLGLTGELPFGGGQHLLTGSYSAQTEWFYKFDEQDHTDHVASGALELNYVPFSLKVDELFRRTVSRSDTEFTDRTKRAENTVRGLLEIPFASFFLETEVDDYYINYLDDANNGFDHNELTLYQRVGFDIGPSTQFLGEYGYINIHYDDSSDRDGDANQFSIGLRGNFSERISYQLWGGFQSRIYDEDSRPDFHSGVFRSAVQYDISDVSNIIIKASRSPQESTFDNQSFFVRNRAELIWKQQIAERLFLTTRGVYDYNEYSRITVRPTEEKTRRDSVIQGSLGLDYTLPNEWVTLFGEYKYSARDSNFSSLSYEDNVVNAGVRANF